MPALVHVQIEAEATLSRQFEQAVEHRVEIGWQVAVSGAGRGNGAKHAA